MSTGTTKKVRKVVVLSWHRHRFTNEEYGWLIESGFFEQFDLGRAFLWNGEIVEPMSVERPHSTVISALFGLLLARFPRAEWTTGVNQGVILGPLYRPKPDLSVLRGSARSWVKRGRVSRTDDMVLLVEVSDSTYRTDSTVKLREYAASGVARLWIVNVAELRVEVYNDSIPSESSYGTRTLYGPDASIPLPIPVDGAIIDFEPIPVRDILCDLLPE